METLISVRSALQKHFLQKLLDLDDYLQTFNKDNVTLVTEPIVELTQNGIKTHDNTEHQLDAIVYATGFDLEQSAKAFEIVGLSGKIDTIELKAYFGITHPEYPNAFVLIGK